VWKLATSTVSVNLTGDSALWSDFNKVNHSAMIKSEVLSRPVTVIVLVLAFGSLVAAGLPLMLTLVGLLTAAGALVISTHIAPVSIWALNFALMFALALGIDYALFLVVRFRAALARLGDQSDRKQAAVDAVAETMGTARKAIAFSGVTVLVSLSTVLLVPSPAFRSMALGIMLSVIAVLAATLTLLPAVLGALGPKIDAGLLKLPKRMHADRKPRPRRGIELLLHRWGAVLHRRPWLAGGLVLAALALLAAPVLGPRTGMPSIAIIPSDQSARAGYNQVVQAFGPGAPGSLQIVTPSAGAPAADKALAADDGIAASVPGGQHNGWTMLLAIPRPAPRPRPPGRPSTASVPNCRRVPSSVVRLRTTTTSNQY
jgi:RND superfamily putative drug exporter